jgi:hypothetical protein
MTPPRPSRASRFADEAVVSIGKARLHERIADRDERMWLVLEEEEQHGGRIEELEQTDAGLAVEIVGGDWRARWVLTQQAGVAVVRSVTLEPNAATTPAGGVTTNLLRELSPQRALAAVVEGIPQAIDVYSRPEQKSEARPRGGRPRVSDEELARVASNYLAELQSGQSGITTRMRLALGYPKDSTVRDRIRMARDRGFLTATKRGRRGGGPGPALLEMQQTRDVEEQHG